MISWSGVRNHQESESITSRISTKSCVCLSHNQYQVELVLKAAYVVRIPMLYPTPYLLNQDTGRKFATIKQESESISSRFSTKSYVCLSYTQYLVELVLKTTYVVGIPMLSNAR
jgi:hypothetical protein